MDVALYAFILVLFASWMTVHVALCAHLARQRWWKGGVALLVPPLAPWWARTERGWVIGWLSCAVAYAVGVTAGTF